MSKEKNISITIRISEEMKEKLQKFSEKNEETIS